MRLLGLTILILACVSCVAGRGVDVIAQKTLPISMKRGNPNQEKVYVMLHHSNGLPTNRGDIIMNSLRAKGYNIVDHYNEATLVVDIDFQYFMSSSQVSSKNMSQQAFHNSILNMKSTELANIMVNSPGASAPKESSAAKSITIITLGSILGFLMAGIPGSILGGLLGSPMISKGIGNVAATQHYASFVDIKISQAIGQETETKYKSFFSTPNHTKEIFYSTKEKWIDHRTGLLLTASGRHLDRGIAARAVYDKAAVIIAEIL